MQLCVFAIRMEGDTEAVEGVNRFLRGNRVLSVDKVGMVGMVGPRSAPLVDLRRAPPAPCRCVASLHQSAASGAHQPRIDYREILSEPGPVEAASGRPRASGGRHRSGGPGAVGALAEIVEVL